MDTTVHRSHTYSFGRLCTDGEAGPQKAPQGCRELELGCSPSVEASPEQDSKVTHLRKDPDVSLEPHHMNTQPSVYPTPGPVSIKLCPTSQPTPKPWTSSTPMLSMGTLGSQALRSHWALTSWGISCRRMAMVVRSPICRDGSLSLRCLYWVTRLPHTHSLYKHVFCSESALCRSR